MLLVLENMSFFWKLVPVWILFALVPTFDRIGVFSPQQRQKKTHAFR